MTYNKKDQRYFLQKKIPVFLLGTDLTGIPDYRWLVVGHDCSREGTGIQVKTLSRLQNKQK